MPRSVFSIAAGMLATVLLAMPLTLALAADAPSKSAMDEKAIAAERGKLITPTVSPDDKFQTELNDKGEYLYAATAAQSLLSNDELKPDTHKSSPGLTLMQVPSNRSYFSEQPDVHGAYWKLGAIKPGKYYVAVGSNSQPLVFLNGRIIQATRYADPVQVWPGMFINELQVDQPIELKPGDEISVQLRGHLLISHLVLRTAAPVPGRHPAAQQFGGGSHVPYTCQTLGVEVTWLDKSDNILPRVIEYWTSEQIIGTPEMLKTGPDGRPVVSTKVYNPLPVAVKAKLEITVRSYYRNIVGKQVEEIELQPHQRIEKLVSFDIIPDEPSYSAFAKIEAIDKPELGWPEGDTVSYFEGLRNTIPWTNPFKHWMLRRVEFTQPIQSVRQVINLNGDWERADSTEWKVTWPMPESLVFKPGKVPMGWHTNRYMRELKPRHHTVYLRRKFTVPPEAAGRTYNVIIGYAEDGAAVYVNGQHVGTVLGGNTPLIADATKAIKVGENEIVVQVLNLLVLMNPAYVDPKDPQPSPFYLDIPGFFSGDGPGIGSIAVTTSPAAAAHELQALPSFRNMDLATRYQLVNHRDKPGKFRVKAHVLDEDKSVFAIDEREVTLEPHKPMDVEIKKPWANPRLWDPRDPHLYVLAIETFDAETGERIDIARERFGFRECWIDGPNIMFNGNAIKPKGCFEPRDETATLTRGTMGKPDWYAEMGRMGFHFITQLTNSSSRHNLERDAYWENCKINAIKSLKRMVNNPSVIAWDLSNEWLCFMDYYAPDPMFGAKRFKDVSDHVRKYDHTRWTLFNAEGDLNGLLDNHAHHYMTPFYGQERITGHHAYWPDAEFWRPLDRHFKDREEFALSPFKNTVILRPHEKVIMDTEFLWKVNETMPPHLTQFCDEGDVLGWAVDNSSGPTAWFWKTKIDGHRDMGTSLIHHYRHTGIHSRACCPQTFIMPDIAHNGFAGDKLVKLLTILNDESSEANVDLRWELLDGATEVLRGNEALQMKSGSRHPTQIELTLPAVKERTRFTLRMRMYIDNKFNIGQELDVDVWPNQAIAPPALARKVFLFDPSGNTGKVLQHAGVAFEPMAQLAAPAGEPDKAVLIIGENALNEDTAYACVNLTGFVADGGRVLVLGQKFTPTGLPADTKLDPANWASICFARMGAHPIVKGFTSWDLSFWSKDRAVSPGSYSKPDSGLAFAIIDSGGQGGLEYVHLMEQYRGKGLYMLCQLPLVGKYDVEPMTRELLARTMDYLGNAEAIIKPVGTLQAVVEANSEVQKRLEDITAKFEVTSLADLNATRPALLEASAVRAAAEQDQAALAKFLADGGKLAVAGATPDDAAWLTKLAGTEVKFTVLPYANWLGRGMRSGYSPFTAGISHLELYYKRYDPAESGGGQSENLALVIEPLQDWVASAVGATELAWPGLLLEVKVGKGTLLIDQRRWQTASGDLAKLAYRNLSALMLGLGVEMAFVVPLRRLPKELAYETIDLTPWCNRSLQDEKAEDGVGGWSDQGGGADLRHFNTGRVYRQGIPFFVSDPPKSCIVLPTKHRPGWKDMAQEVMIPVGKAVEGLYFLHGFAYGGGQPTYEVQYEDGTIFPIEMKYGINVRDWASAPLDSFPRERKTTSTIAWSGPSNMFPIVSVYKTLWVNPKPDVKVKAIRYHKDVETGGVPVLMGVTSVLKRQAKALNNQDKEQFKRLVEQASAAQVGKNLDEAAKLLRQALAMDPHAWDLYQTLADILEQKGDDQTRLDHYLEWVYSGATVPLPYNRAAEIMEKQKDLRGALEFYKRSLKVEWNQPPAIEHCRRLEAELRK